VNKSGLVALLAIGLAASACSTPIAPGSPGATTSASSLAEGPSATASASSEPTGAMIEVLPRWFPTAADLVAAADVIVTGTVTASRGRMIDVTDYSPSDDPTLNPALDPSAPPAPSYVPYTVHDLSVTRVWKGSVSVGATLPVAEVGGMVDGTYYEPTTGMLLADGETYLVFLSAYTTDPYELAATFQAVYPVAADGTLTTLADNPLDVADVLAAIGG